MTKYKATITGIGPDAMEFLSPELDLNFVIIFNDDAPAELAELAILHTAGELIDSPVRGDTLKLGKKTYSITAVGDEAIHTLRQLGHCTLMFSPDEKPYRPGCIMLNGAPITKEDIPSGETIEIYS